MRAWYPVQVGDETWHYQVGPEIVTIRTPDGSHAIVPIDTVTSEKRQVSASNVKQYIESKL